MSITDIKLLDDLTDELLLATDFQTVEAIAWNIKVILTRNKAENDLLNLAKSLMYKEAERLGCL